MGMRYVCSVLLLACSISLAFGITVLPYNEEKALDREIIRQVASWLVQAVRGGDANLLSPFPHKRNSEIINSILGLPKNLNDIGRK